MSQNLQIPRGLLIGLVLALTASLLGLAFLLGRQSANPVALATATPHYQPPQPAGGWLVPEEVADTQRLRPSSNRLREPNSTPTYQGAALAKAMLARRRADRAAQSGPIPVEGLDDEESSGSAPSRSTSSAASADSSISTRPRTAPKAAPLATSHQGTTSTVPASRKPNLAARAEVKRYLAQVDALTEAQGMGDPNQVAMELLQQSLQGDNSGMDSLLASTKSTLVKLEAVQPPNSCREHHTLLLKQLRQGVALLSGVGKATGTLDTSSLTKLSSQGKSMQAEAQRFAELDRQLRSGI